MDNPDYRRIEKAIIFLDEHAPEQPTLEEVADHISLSPFHFQRLFKSWAGVSPKRFLQYLTLENAKRLLRESASVLDASLEVGLSGPGRLHDLFISVEAMTPGEYKARGRGLEINYGFHGSPFGECLVAVTSRGVCGLSFVEAGRSDTLLQLAESWQEAKLIENPGANEKIATQIFSQSRVGTPPPVKILLKGTNFQIKVWEALLKIPEGRVVSYGNVADAVGRHGASRAVGTAVGQNPIAFLIPCHRVLRSNGGIGGYRWGTTRKRAILAREAALWEHGDMSGLSG